MTSESVILANLVRIKAQVIEKLPQAVVIVTIIHKLIYNLVKSANALT